MDRILRSLAGLLLVGLAASTSLLAQSKAFNVWYFGYSAGISFDGGSPTALFDGRISTEEGSAVQCDPKTGALLFYTDGRTVWDASHEVMESGTNLDGHFSSSQTALILPDPGDSLGYYIFTVDAGPDTDTDPAYKGLRYSRVDMRRAGGRGGVTLKNVPLFDSATEKLTATKHCNGRDYWVMTHGWGTNEFRAFLLSATGVTVPVISKVGSVYYRDDVQGYTYIWRTAIGYARFSPDGRRLASVNAFVFDTRTGNELKSNVELFDFDNSTGRLSGGEEILMGTPPQRFYSLAFSPNSSKLYVSNWEFSSTLWQLDLAAGDAAAIRSSVRRIDHPNMDIGALQLGPDGRIYGCHRGIGRLDVINRPNELAPDCDFVARAISLGGPIARAGLPNMPDCDMFPRQPIPFAGAMRRDTICRGDARTLTVVGGREFLWMPATGLSCTNCATPTAAPTSTTTYTVNVYSPGICNRVDTFVVVVREPPIASAGTDRAICPGGSVELSATGGVSYRWDPADDLSCTDCANPIASPATTTDYRVEVTDAVGCRAVDTVRIEVGPRLVRAHIDRTYRVVPGEKLRVAVVLDNVIDFSTVDSVTFSFDYAPEILRPFGVATNGSSLHGWSVRNLRQDQGRWSVRMLPASGPRFRGDTIAFVEMQSFLGEKLLSELPFMLELHGVRCVEIRTSAGLISVDSICGLSYRLIELDTTGYALTANVPNPFDATTTIAFTLGLEGYTRLEILDANGAVVEVLIDRSMKSGRHEIVWDGSPYPSGLYYSRIISGAWSRTRQMVLMK